MKKTTLLTVRTLLTIVKLLTQLHLLDDFLIIIPVPHLHPFLLALVAQTNKLLPIWWWLP
jgi:hypothetical protein